MRTKKTIVLAFRILEIQLIKGKKMETLFHVIFQNAQHHTTCFQISLFNKH